MTRISQIFPIQSVLIRAVCLPRRSAAKAGVSKNAGQKREGKIDKKGRWAIIEHKALFDTTQFQEIKIWHLDKIPWRNIRLYDLDGDEYYNIPHIWCAFANGQGPYEGIQFAMLGENHDWPLDDKKRIRQEDVIKH
jgi:hypothetical protein